MVWFKRDLKDNLKYHLWSCSAVRKYLLIFVFVSFPLKGTFCESGSLWQDTRRKSWTVSRWWEHRWTKSSLWRFDSCLSSHSSSSRPCSPLPLCVQAPVPQCSARTRDRQLLWGSRQQEGTPSPQQWEVTKSFWNLSNGKKGTKKKKTILKKTQTELRNIFK